MEKLVQEIKAGRKYATSHDKAERDAAYRALKKEGFRVSRSSAWGVIDRETENERFGQYFKITVN